MALDQCDYIIVGNGLAGATLAMHLTALDKKLVIFEGKQNNVSSMVAAGLFNPITGRKMVKTWKADELFPALIKYYKACETVTQGHFFHKKTIYRPFFLAEEQNEWMGKSADQTYDAYIDQVVKYSTTAQDIKDPFGGLKLSSCGYVDIPEYIGSVSKYLKNERQVLLKEDFDIAQADIDNRQIQYGNLTAKKIIFCEGVGLTKNPYLKWLPIRPVKGEILFIRTEYKMDYILNRGVFVLPIGNDIYKVGSTYDHHDTTLKPTEKGKEQIIQRLSQVLTCDFELVDHVVGLRPATKDRKPFVGIHPEIETIGVFNGLGTKGVSLAPYWANHFVEHLENGKKLDVDVNISRFNSLYSGSFNNR